jgi:hypothetical protein
MPPRIIRRRLKSEYFSAVSPGAANGPLAKVVNPASF